MRQLITLLWILLLVPVSGRTGHAQTSEQDSLALVALYNATDGPNWIDNTNWLTGPVSAWFGVHVSGDRVSSLQLDDNQLTGSIPIELGTLTTLTSLFLGANQLTGSIPKELGSLANLQVLNLVDNQLTGSIPMELGTLTNLEILELTSNQLTGGIPVEFGSLTTLTDLFLGSNQLTGSIPPELGNLTGLITLSLIDNKLTGAIPPEVGNLANLIFLFLGLNQLTGSIPEELGSLTNLQVLSLIDNQLTGSIPEELGSLTNLNWLNLRENQLTGQVPPELGTLTTLTDLFLSANPLNGTLPLSFVNLSMLDLFWFDETNLCEPIDPAFQAWLHTISNVRSTGCTNVAIEETTEILSGFTLEANYPNPFNPTTTIRYGLPQQASVRLGVYDVQGRLVAVLVEAEQAMGWHEVTFEAGALPSGIYFYRLEAGTFQDVKTMFLR